VIGEDRDLRLLDPGLVVRDLPAQGNLLQHAHAALDPAVWAVYVWDDPKPVAVGEDTILARLLALNSHRADRMHL
jgi:hypothetical protein